MTRKRNHDQGRRSFTTYALKHPIETCMDCLGDFRIAVWANQKGLPVEVMTRLQDAATGYQGDVRRLMELEVLQAERKRIPLACFIMGER